MRLVPVGPDGTTSARGGSEAMPWRGASGVEPRVRMSPQRGDYESAPTPRRGKSVRRSRRGLRKKRLKQLATILLLATGPTVAVTWLMISPRFAVRELTVFTGDRVPEPWVREALAPVVGENLPRLPLAQAEQILRAHPWVHGADLRKDLPARLSVRVAERRAVALLRADDGLHYLDSRGVRIAPFSPTAKHDVDLPLISLVAPVESDSPAGPEHGERAALRSAVQLLSEIDEVEPSWAASLSEIEILGEEDFRVHTPELPFPLLVRTGTLHQRVRRLEELLPHIVARFDAVGAVDLRFARRIIVKPSVNNGSRPRRASKTEHIEATTDHAQRG